MRKTKGFSGFIAGIFIFLALSGCGGAEEEPGISRIEWNNHDVRAEQVVTALVNGDFTIVAEGFDDDMSRALDVSGLRKAWRDTVRAAGAFNSIGGTEYFTHEEYEVYNVVTLHERRNINTRIVFSEESKIAGLFFTFI